jgi:hypothetical protein
LLVALPAATITMTNMQDLLPNALAQTLPQHGGILGTYAKAMTI